MADNDNSNFMLWLKAAMREAGIGDGEIGRISEQIVSCFGGGDIYINKTDPSRREKVLAEFNGRNRREVCQRHGISKSQFYAYLKGD